MLPRLDVGADARMFHIVIDDNLVGIVIQRHALSKLIFGRNDNLFATSELDRALGCTTVRVELAYGRPSRGIKQRIADPFHAFSHHVREAVLRPLHDAPGAHQVVLQAHAHARVAERHGHVGERRPALDGEGRPCVAQALHGAPAQPHAAEETLEPAVYLARR